MTRKEKTPEELISAIYQALFSSQYSVHFHVKNLPGISIRALPLQQDACASNWVVNIESGDPELRAAIRHAASMVQHEFDLISRHS